MNPKYLQTHVRPVLIKANDFILRSRYQVPSLQNLIFSNKHRSDRDKKSNSIKMMTLYHIFLFHSLNSAVMMIKTALLRSTTVTLQSSSQDLIFYFKVKGYLKLVNAPPPALPYRVSKMERPKNGPNKMKWPKNGQK